ncbi:flagellar hook-length control protein FliK [Idiomarina sp. HP20-50]|uniref:flagellar hook-length control protein FliK n=1 Tax=Idiomarina sp. HP20-50 TaxID=3070813 RepID=UPI00294AC237|nr:flagellar hook-length control protein FliK [Idiomarina sp. HP20-50]MDV6316936.1 flagellar hook-length control protein FliK [Idiomarina sp. HP20-50]
MADIKQLLQQMMASPERTLARAEQQQLSSLMRIFNSSVTPSQTNSTLTGTQQTNQQPLATSGTGNSVPITKPNTAKLLSALLVQIRLPVTYEPAKGQQPPRIQGNNWQWPNPPKGMLPQLTTPTKLQLTVTQPDPKLPVVRLTLSSPGSNSKSIAVTDLPVTQLPAKLVKALVEQGQVATAAVSRQSLASPSSLTSSTAVKPGLSPLPGANSAPKEAQRVSIPAVSGLAIKQAQQVTPKQFQQTLHSLIPENIRPKPLSTAQTDGQQQAPIRLSADAAREALQSTPKALQQVLLRVLQQMPTAESMQRPQALQSWVSDWFAARPVSAHPGQQMGGLGQMLMTLLGLAMQQQPDTAASSSTARTSPNQLTQALIQQVLNPAPENAGEVRERINALLQQLPQQQLQRLLQLFTGILNSAQSSQARLQDSPPQQPEYYILLPSDAQKPQQHELLIRSEKDHSNKEGGGRTLWLFTLRFELESTGPLLVKGRYHPQGSSVDFYTETKAAQSVVETHVERLETRLQELEVNSVKLRVQQGKIPDNLAQQHSGIIRVTV